MDISSRFPVTTLTNIKGVFAAGDVQDKRNGRQSLVLVVVRFVLPDVIVYWDADFDSYVSRLHGHVGG